MSCDLTNKVSKKVTKYTQSTSVPVYAAIVLTSKQQTAVVKVSTICYQIWATFYWRSPLNNHY